MYEPDTCPVCDREFEAQERFDPFTTLHSGQLDSRFCVMASETRMWVYIHEGDVSEV